MRQKGKKESFKISSLIEEFENERLYDEDASKLSGSVYTPPYITNFMVKRAINYFLEDLMGDGIILNKENSPSKNLENNPTLENKIKNKLPSFKILDPACGTGRFLISACKELVKLYKILYPHLKGWDIRRNIVRQHIYGVEVEKKAYLLTKLRLLNWVNPRFQNKLRNTEKKSKIKLISELEKMLEDESENFNIFHCDYLFSFKKESNFNLIIGNPPYIENKKIRDPKYKKALYKSFNTAYKLFDLSILFIERSLELLKINGGYLSFLMPNKFLAADYGIKIRKLIHYETDLEELINISSCPVFSEKAIYPVIITLSNQKKKNNKFSLLKFSEYPFSEENLKPIKVEQSVLKKLPSFVIPITERIKSIGDIYANIKPMTSVFKNIKIIYRPFGFLNYAKNINKISQQRHSKNDLLLLGTGNVGKYHIKFEKPIHLARQKFNIAYIHFDEKFQKVWEELSQEKIIYREIAKDLTCVYDPGFFSNLTGLYFIRISSFSTDQYFALLAILNSQLINDIFNGLFGTLHMSGGYLRFNGSFIKRLPIIEKLPFSLSRLGKLSQFLSQLQYDLVNRSISNSANMKSKFKNILPLNLKFSTELTNALVNYFYLREMDGMLSERFDIIGEFVQRDNFLPDFSYKYNIKRFESVSMKTFEEKEMENLLISIDKNFNELRENERLTSAIKKLEGGIFQ
jgi:hypothetical protein